MNTTLVSKSHGQRTADESHPLRYHIYRQARAGNFMLEFKTDSAFDAVEYFGIISPAYEGGAIRLWDEHEQRIGAEVEWKTARTEIGLPVSRRRDVFHDPILAAVASDAKERRNIREEIQQSIRMSA